MKGSCSLLQGPGLKKYQQEIFEKPPLKLLRHKRFVLKNNIESLTLGTDDWIVILYVPNFTF